jgi:hypothetical protein
MDDVYCDPVQPGSKRTVSAKSAKTSPHADENILREILGVSAAIGQRAREAHDRHLMAANEIVKSLTAARGRLRDQLLVDVHSAMSLQLAARRSGSHLVGPRSSRLYSREYSRRLAGP